MNTDEQPPDLIPAAEAQPLRALLRSAAETSLLTPTLKVKREEGERRFAAEIDGLDRSSRPNELSKHHQSANPIHSDGDTP
jgi:hypothetical protein